MDKSFVKNSNIKFYVKFFRNEDFKNLFFLKKYTFNYLKKHAGNLTIVLKPLSMAKFKIEVLKLNIYDKKNMAGLRNQNT